MKDTKTREGLLRLARRLGFKPSEYDGEIVFESEYYERDLIELRRDFYILLNYLEVKIVDNNERVVVKKKKDKC